MGSSLLIGDRRIDADAVVYAVDERDVQQAVRWAARTGTRIAASPSRSPSEASTAAARR